MAHGPGHLERSSRGGKRTGERVQAAIAEHAARLSGISGDDLKDRASIRNLLAHAIKAGIEGKLPSSRVAVVSTLLNTAIRLLSVSDEPTPSAPTKVEFVVKDFARSGGDVERKDAVVVDAPPAPAKSFRCPGRDGECAAPLAVGTDVCWRCGSRLTWKSGA